MQQTIRKVVIVGGGTAGWMSAALLKKVLGPVVDIQLIESDQIATVGVGEATIPPIQHVNTVLGLNEAEFLRETKASIKLAIRFENWHREGESYFHTFGAAGQSSAFCQFHHYWRRASSWPETKSLWDYDLNYLAACAGKFSKLKTQDARLEMPYAYHFDASLYGQYLRKISEGLGVKRREGLVEDVELCQNTGGVSCLHLVGGEKVGADLFIDCSGFRALLLQKAMGVGFEDWSHWLPCDTAVSVPSERFANTLPYTRSIARDAGWQWRIPLQHRNGNGLVYCSRFVSDDEATASLMNNLGSKALDEPRINRFRTGRARRQWHKNVVGIGLASGFLEPLESTSIHLIQSAVVRLLKYFPHQGVHKGVVARYNRESQVEYEQVRDFLILHYTLNDKQGSDFWRQMQTLTLPETLQNKLNVFNEQGLLLRDDHDLFAESSWLQVLLGQGQLPRDYHPLVARMSDAQLQDMLAQTARLKAEPIAQMLSHDDFLARFTQVKTR
ncbi:tryptophan 7-halogenase [Gilvimarinus sp. SDUM040013]|uniref:Tryptophan halogenase family protein n=1 Tax=Gilvimarinus gilvus TaxID=3058038 RepID=A0ABU4S1Q7_9GAMM|nr:tryptophan halogenase family protein [Gilvimarinus sp. SDUM040013]MDO3384445.1 tryptophan 7-halogenase [Gilvimarinus sp. SDUM040013]MDX6851086.1 tryptophan halogenase family protein [Gilvimarinus sp. SDUM040013]